VSGPTDGTGATGGVSAAEFGARLETARHRMATATSGDPTTIRIVAVTKGFGSDAVEVALAAGLGDIGENYADELLAKSAAIKATQEELTGPTGPGAPNTPAGDPESLVPTWHFLGAIQRNKVARLSPVVTWWQGVSRVEEGLAIARRRPEATLLVQVDLAGMAGRGGCAPDRIPELVGSLRDQGINVAGLMAVGVPGPPEASRSGFASVSRLADQLDLEVRSMGMTDDLEVAVAEGSTMVRLGRALFGSRPVRTGGR
jgi:PLP dependent protein